MTSIDHTLDEAWPACALGGWAAAWLAGRCAPDDVSDTLGSYASVHTVTDHTDHIDSSAHAGNGVLTILGALSSATWLAVRLPGPGDLQGLPPHPATTAALDAGEILLAGRAPGSGPLALVPCARNDGLLEWETYIYDRPVTEATVPAGEIEYELRQAVTAATDVLVGLGHRPGAVRTDLREVLRTQTMRHLVDLPPHDDTRAARMIESAAQVDAIVALARSEAGTLGDSARSIERGDSELQRLGVLARRARAAAVNRVIAGFGEPGVARVNG